MKKMLLMLLCVCCTSLFTIAQSIIAAEYFFNTDPGVGNGTAIPVTPGTTVSFLETVSVSALPAGFNFIAVRTKDADGVWGFLEVRGFYISTATTNTGNITAAEYFIDNDPGIGNGTALNVGANGVTVNFVAAVPVASLSTGFHFIAIRIKDADGKWGLFENRGFYISAQTTNAADIVAAEYFIDADPGVGNGTAIAISTPISNYSDSLIFPLGSLPLGNYHISIRVKNSVGQWSLMESKPFAVCTTNGAQSEMTYKVEGNQVFFTNKSLYYDTVTWKFGDNTLDTVFNPIKTYTNAGVYNLQLITGNSCGIDTLSEPIEIRGLQRVNANRAGNAGISTLMFEGFGFTPATEVKLILGTQVFSSAAKFFVNNIRIRANFNLTGFTPGVYRAVATIGSAFDTLNNALIIEASVLGTVTLDISNGRQTVRTGRVIVNGSIKNSGSHDAIMVPYVTVANFVPGVTGNVNVNLALGTSMAILTNQGIFQHTLEYLGNNGVPPDVMHVNDLDSARNRHIVAYYKTRVPGHSSKQELVGLSHTGQAYTFQTGAMVLGPLLDSYALLDSIHTDYQACYSSFLKQEIEKQLNITVNEAAWNTCFIPAFDTLMRTLAKISQNPLFENDGVPMQAGFSALLAKMADCPGSGVPSNLGGIQFKRIIQGVMNNWIYLEDIDSLDTDCIDTTVIIFSRRMNNISGNAGVMQNKTAGGGCADCPGAASFPEMCDQCLPLLQAGKVGKKLKIKGRAFGANSAVKGCQEWCENTSRDPNLKYGPGNNGNSKFINHIKHVNYKIEFENVDTATAPAAYIEIRDTIDKTVFDISTLNLGVFSWGDSLIAAEPNEQNVSILKNIKPTHPNFLRIDATTDTASGIVLWKFWTVDTVTLQLTTSPTEGFLPPNIDGISGSGYVTYSIAPKATVTNGTILKNKAAIVFDDNAPTITNEWEYRIDTLQPVSAVNDLQPITNTQNFTVTWAGTDAHAGVDRFSVYVSVNDSAYKVWQSLTEITSAIYPGKFGNTYKFFSVALDKADNFEDPPADLLNNPDAFTSVEESLPLDLLKFTARKSVDGKKVDLIWTTANEQNSSHFEVQRSADGFNYVTIGRVQSLNNSNGANYTWQDAVPLSKINHYRLRVIDMDASFKISPVRVVSFSEKGEILVFPTLTNDIVFLQSGKQVIAELFDVRGIKLKTLVVKENAHFDLSKFPSGIYYIRIASENKTFKILKK